MKINIWQIVFFFCQSLPNICQSLPNIWQKFAKVLFMGNQLLFMTTKIHYVAKNGEKSSRVILLASGIGNFKTMKTYVNFFLPFLEFFGIPKVLRADFEIAIF